MTLSHEYEQAYVKLLDALVNDAARGSWRSESLCAFWPVTGDGFGERRELLVVGRAVNGWDSTFSLAELGDEGKRRDLVERARSESEASLSWVARRGEGEYNPRRSAFWMATRDIVRRIVDDTTDEDWYRCLAWTNLYKIAPAGGGNPSDSLCRVQEDACRALFRREIQELKPRRILCFTGWNWAKDIVPDVIEWEEDLTEELVQRVGTWHQARVVVARHPQGKGREAIVSQVVKALPGSDSHSQ